MENFGVMCEKSCEKWLIVDVGGERKREKMDEKKRCIKAARDFPVAGLSTFHFLRFNA